MKFRFIDDQRRYHGAGKMADVLGVSRAGYCAWTKRPKSGHACRDEQPVNRIKKIQQRLKIRYGSPRMTKVLDGAGDRVGHNRVARLMHHYELGRRPRKPYRPTTNSNHQHPVAENLVNRVSEVPEANRLWSSAITYVATAEGWLYPCVVIDLYPRKVIGWTMKRTMEAVVVVEAMMMALVRRRWPQGVIFHSDRGSQHGREREQRSSSTSKCSTTE